jgi:hypothetical protein
MGEGGIALKGSEKKGIPRHITMKRKCMHKERA